jgi:hypothetical protein
MENAEDRQRDTAAGPAGLTEVPKPPTMERKLPAWVTMAIMLAVAVVVAVVILTAIPNGAATN